jgi:hypothetical protein
MLAPMNPKEPLMIDRLFLATLTLGMLMAGSLTIASAVFDGSLRTPVRVLQLEPVVVTAKRLAPAAEVASVACVEPAAQRAQ